MRWAFGFVVGLCLASTVWAADAVAPQVGPVAVGMSVEAAQTALPSASWTNVLSPLAGKVIGTKADAAWTLDEQPYELGVRPLRYGAAMLTLRSQTQAGSVRTCRARVLALAAYFEQFFAELRPADDALAFKTRKAGRNAQVGETQDESDNDLFSDISVYGWSFEQAPSAAYPFGVTATAQFVQKRKSCAIAADVTVPAKDRPEFEMLDTKTIKPAWIPSLETLSSSIEGLDLPKGGKTASLNCEVVRASGHLRDCFEGARGGESTPEGRAAKIRAGQIAFDPKQLEPDNDVPLRAMIAMKLLPLERQAPKKIDVSRYRRLPSPPPFPTPPSTPFALAYPQQIWAKVPTSEELSARYPTQALNESINGSIVASCTVRADLSLLCNEITSDPPGVFEDAARSVLALYRVAPALKDGTLAVGATFKVRVRFVVQN